MQTASLRLAPVLLAGLLAVAPAPLRAQPPGASVLARLWPATTPILVLGENHESPAHTRFVRGNLDALRSAGLTRLAIEIPADEQIDIDRYLAGPERDADWLSRALWQVAYRDLPEAYVETLEMIVWARRHGVAVVAIDAAGPLQVRLGAAQAELASRGIAMPHSAAAQRAWARAGSPREFRHATSRDVVREFWRQLLHGRTRAMAANLERCVDGRTVAVVGAIHAALEGWEGTLAASGIDPRDIPPGGIADVARVPMHTVVVVGGIEPTRTLHPVETYVLEHHDGTQPLALSAVRGLGCVDAVAFLPFLTPAPATVAGVADRPGRNAPELPL